MIFKIIKFEHFKWFQAVQEDNPDRYALATLTVSRVTSVTKEIRFLQRIYHVTAPENLPGGSIIATLNTNHPRDV